MVVARERAHRDVAVVRARRVHQAWQVGKQHLCVGLTLQDQHGRAHARDIDDRIDVERRSQPRAHRIVTLARGGEDRQFAGACGGSLIGRHPGQSLLHQDARERQRRRREQNDAGDVRVPRGDRGNQFAAFAVAQQIHAFGIDLGLRAREAEGGLHVVE